MKFRLYYNTYHTICVSSEKFMREDQAQIKSIIFGGKFSVFALFEREPSVLNSTIEKRIYTSVPFT